MSPQCLNCGAHVTARALRVMYPEEVDLPERCPMCAMRRNGRWVEPRSSKHRESEAGPNP
jgi:DNA-directed RNA polymerase subunit RPC12/RpoP